MNLADLLRREGFVTEADRVDCQRAAGDVVLLRPEEMTDQDWAHLNQTDRVPRRPSPFSRTPNPASFPTSEIS